MGEPAGIASDITIAAWHKLSDQPQYGFFAIADPNLLAARAHDLGSDVPIETIERAADACAVFPSALPVLSEELPSIPGAGDLDPANAASVLASINRAVELVLTGEASAVVTNPIQKETLYRAGFSHQGHTDYLAHLARRHGHAAEPVMMLVSGTLRTVPLTVHIPLRDVPEAISAESIMKQVRVISRDLERLFHIATPRIAVTGLNPHAGEQATIGTEERDVIEPAVAKLASEGLDVTGPVAADTLFHETARLSYDAVLCMYHDQALIPIKTIGFHDGVNTTLGLPFIRTSPDHGTALKLAGTGRADPSSLISAIRLATEMAGAA